MQWLCRTFVAEKQWLVEGPASQPACVESMSAGSADDWYVLVFVERTLGIAPEIVSAGLPAPLAKLQTVQAPGWQLNRAPENLVIPVIPFLVPRDADKAFAAAVEWSVSLLSAMPKAEWRNGILAIGTDHEGTDHESTPPVAGPFVRRWLGLAVS